MTTVKAVFQTNHLESILDKSIVAHQLRGDTDCELLALKVKLFIHNGNFLSEKQVRDSLPTLPSRANGMFIRLGKTGSLGPWSRVIVYCSKLSFCKNDPPIGGSLWQKEGLLQYIMTLIQGPKDPVLPTLMFIIFFHNLIYRQIFVRSTHSCIN